MEFSILSSKCEHIDNNYPTTFYVFRFGNTHVRDASDNVFFDFLSSMQVIQHDCFERLKKIFLEAIVAELLFEKKFVC